MRGDECRVDVALNLAQRDGRFAECPVSEAHAVPGVLPSLVLESAVTRPLVLDVSVAVAVAIGLDPFEASIRDREECIDLVAPLPPPLQLAQQHHEQRRCVDAAVVHLTPTERE